MKKILLSFLLLVVAVCAFAQERFLFFDVQARVNTDGSVTIAEKMTINVEHKDIFRGITRDIPLKKGEYVEVHRLKMDGYTHPFSMEKKGQKVYVYFGDDRHIEKGIHTYYFSYTLFNVIKPFRKYDELYWNVVGPDFLFPIEYARAEVLLPEGIKIFEDKVSIYTGTYGSKQSNANREGLKFWITKPLPPRNAMTVAVPFEKGYIHYSSQQKLQFFWQQNYLLITWIVFALMCLYAYWAWRRVGKDPVSRVVRRYDPPGISPALARYIYEMDYDYKTFAVVLTSLAMKGALVIKQETWEGFVVCKKEYDTLKLSEEECLVYATLPFEKKITGGPDETWQSLSDSVRMNLERQNQKQYFATNVSWVLPLYAVLLLLCFGFYKLDPANIFPVFFLISCLSFFSDRGNIRSWIVFAIMLLFFILFIPLFKSLTSFYVAFVALVFVFSKVVRAYTEHGRELMDEIEGFKEYLSIGEAGRVEASVPIDPQKIFCDYIPYALALGVENEWVESFEKVLSKTEVKKVLSERGLSCEVSIGSAFCSLNYSISSSNPSRSSGGSGSGGGGFAGGGSGGGGVSGR